MNDSLNSPEEPNQHFRNKLSTHGRIGPKIPVPKEIGLDHRRKEIYKKLAFVSLTKFKIRSRFETN
ncbi:hypothetical protein LEP1GSC193_3125 [Leptospira alstonii serovar Pingchang str. 80-412]|uniref:Uncharacterized protein n=2 Tax=Leptospira alstonii TaxID=28452 RepID=M6CGT1_9LEPT|nr:hypothetical protein LEP1GSC194_0079 [Leptospira alstonii serovar Sichuan str. 79601]EQA80777.1 hypothetical protein LEP1GSC193_3125 [Leptospira alstonii serovar Pingchang str. 80-412]